MEMFETSSIFDQLAQKRILATSDIPPHQFLFKWKEIPCFAKGELVALTGKAKSGKTYLNSILMAVATGNGMLDIERMRDEPYRVLWIDTEQSEDSTCEILRDRIGAMIGHQPDETHYYTYNLRSVNWKQRQPMIEAAVVTILPDLVIFDGIRDVVGDINDYTEAQEIIGRLLALASFSNACIVCVLHQNKAVEDKTLRGALGTELQNKSFETYECAKNSETRIFSVKQIATRKYDIIGSQQFTLSSNGLPLPCASVDQEQLPDVEDIFHDALDKPKELRAKALKLQIRTKYGLTDPEYGMLISDALRNGIISKRQVSEHEVYYALTQKELQQKLNFGASDGAS